MFENIINFFKKIGKKEENKEQENSKDAAKERLHLVLMQDRANVSVDFLELMKQEIIDVIKKYIDVDESEIEVKLTNQENPDGTNGAPALYANIPILNIKNDARKIGKKEVEENKEKNEDKKQETNSVENTLKTQEPIKEGIDAEKTEETENQKTEDVKDINEENKDNKENTKTEEKDNSEDSIKNTTDNEKDKAAEEKGKEENQKEIEEQSKIKNIIDGVIANAENNREKEENKQ